MDNWLALVAAVVAVASMIFAGLQTRMLNRQTGFAQRTADLSRESAQLAVSAAELSFNLAVTVRLQEVLYTIADNPAVHDHVWGAEDTDNQRPNLETMALLDLLAVAMSALDR